MENLSPKDFIKEYKSKYGEMALDAVSVLLGEVVRDGKMSHEEEGEVISRFISRYGEMAYYDMIDFFDKMVLNDKMAFSDVIDFLDEMAENGQMAFDDEQYDFTSKLISKYGQMTFNDEQDDFTSRFISNYGEMAHNDMIDFFDKMVLNGKKDFSDDTGFRDKMADVVGLIREMAFNDLNDQMAFDYEQDEIIIKCSLENMAKAFFKDYEIIWHDPNVNSEENQLNLIQLEKLCKVKAFTEWKEAENYIKTAKTVCHVITSGTNGELLVKEIFSSQNVPNILTFCRDKDHHSTWATNYVKILCTETKIEDVILQIQKNLLEWHKQTSSLKFDLPAFAPIFDDYDKSNMNHLHHYLKVIPKFENRAQAKADFITLSREVYSDKKNEKLIADFEKTYTKYNKKALLKWYTQQSFLYKVINNCLRIATSDSIQWSRFLLKDIERAIKDQYKAKSKNFSGLLYRAAYLSEEEWLSLKRNLNLEIEMHGFLSVSKEKNVALKFMGVDPAQKVFITIIVPKGPIQEKQGFAEIEEFSKFPNEKEVLFNVRSRFTVLETEDEYSQAMPYRHLVLLYGAQSLRKFIAKKNPVLVISIDGSKDISCSHCKISASEITEKFFFLSLINLDKRIYSCKNCLNFHTVPFLCIPISEKALTIKIKGCVSMDPSQAKMPLYGYKCSQCEVKNEERYFLCTDCDEIERRWCQHCFKNPLGCIELEHSIILESYPFSFWCKKMSEKELNNLKYQNSLFKTKNHFFQQQGYMYLETHEYEKAMDCFRPEIRKYKEKGEDDTFSIAYQSEDNRAPEDDLKSLTRRESIEVDPLRVASSYDSIAWIHYDKGEYNKALEYFLKSLDICKSVEGENHPNVGKICTGLGLVYAEQEEYDNALEYLFTSLDICMLVYGENDPETAAVYNHIGMIYEMQGEDNEAAEYYRTSLNIRKSVCGENHPEIATSYHSIGSLYHKRGEYNEALEYFQKSLDICKSVFGENNHHVAKYYNSIGSVYSGKKEEDHALKYYLKFLEICKSIYGEDHPCTIIAYSNVGASYEKEGEYDKAVEYALKALYISISVHGKDHMKTKILQEFVWETSLTQYKMQNS